MKRDLYVMALLLGSAAPAEANFQDGNELHELCSADEGSFDYALGLGYTIGVFDRSVATPGVGDYLCAPPHVGAVQVFDVTCQYLRNYPEERHLLAATLTYRAMLQAWPCPTRAPAQ